MKTIFKIFVVYLIMLSLFAIYDYFVSGSILDDKQELAFLFAIAVIIGEFIDDMKKR